MKIINFFRKIYLKTIGKTHTVFKVPREEQEKYIDKFNRPKDLIERSYYQYKCQMYLRGNLYYVLLMSAFFLIPIKLIFSEHKQYSDNTTNKKNLVCRLMGLSSDMIPKEVTRKFDGCNIYDVKNDDDILTMWDIKWFFKNIFLRYPFDFFYQLQILQGVSNYSYIIDRFCPLAIATHMEYSCSATAITQYCHDRGVRHINFMHGDKLWDITDSFFQFDECYIWHEHYKELFVSLRSFTEQFIVAVPPKILSEFECKSIDVSGYNIYDYCYYLGNEDKKQIENIFESLVNLKNNGYSVKIRLHPRYGLHNYVKKLAFNNNIIVEPNEVDINVSIVTTKNVISLFSTVLFQSYNMGVPIIVDDISDNVKFRQLKELDYIVFSFKHRLLSEIV